MKTPALISLCLAAGALGQVAAARLMPTPAIAIADTAPAPAEVAPEPVAIDFSANQSQADDHGPLIAKDGSELAPYGDLTCAEFYQWPLAAADWNGNGAIDMEDEINLCVQ